MKHHLPNPRLILLGDRFVLKKAVNSSIVAVIANLDIFKVVIWLSKFEEVLVRAHLAAILDKVLHAHLFFWLLRVEFVVDYCAVRLPANDIITTLASCFNHGW